ncbi:MAG: SpvB/TcaC N-terminal domain-containing protein, partial [Kiritimatiellae bacterium]|nr:SpvB/TcaC N-terminal domain-containing protein [Kiritimatiellia bacterium]
MNIVLRICCLRFRIYRRHLRRAWALIQEGTTWLLTLALIVSQLQFLPEAQAGSPGTTTVSAGSAPSPAASTVESFQPDLFTGRAGASVPIGIPPGRKNMQPQLALSYASSGRNGWIGVGWNLDMGCIERSTKFGTPSYTDLDLFTFQLGGGSSEMVKLADGTYRAEDEGLFMKFENLGTNGWQVTDKSGTRYLLGKTASARVENGTKVFRWCLEKVMDANGNSMEILYEKTNSVVSTLKEIRYTGHESGTPAPANRVVFYTESRPDISSSYRSGFEMPMTRRLSRIESYATVDGSEQLATRYDLAYRQSSRTGQSLLESVTPFGSDGVSSLPPRTFTYQDSDSPQYDVTLKPGTGSQIAWNVRVAAADMGHDNFGCVDPYVGLPWGTPVV